MSGTLAQTPLHDWHAAHHGRLVDFAGWSMPVQYTSIVAEHLATRASAGLFDISHMGRLRFDGPGAGAFLDSLITRRVEDQLPGQIRYALVTNDAGGVLDDVLVYHLADARGSAYRLLVVNASNREKILAWIEPRLAGREDVSLRDLTHDWAMLAVQGPRALRLAQPLVDVELAELKYYTGAEARVGGQPGIVSRTGYTGEDGCELIVPSSAAPDIWQKLVDAGATPAGLGCRDTLRLEAGMPLYGHELNEQIDPYQAGLAFAVNLAGRQFIGRDALALLKADRTRAVRVGLELSGKRVPREGFDIKLQNRRVGQISSGTFSPTLEKPLAMGHVEPAWAAPGQQLMVDIRGRDEPAVVVALPFYRRA
ncbi:MAG TPA: glycine cleavage system aminomethyltransferase GcvT [Pirellulales bacterium]|nr:glycine cleavage system aminomethyltransferase GcvT [Pirellulales bacterium]